MSLKGWLLTGVVLWLFGAAWVVWVLVIMMIPL